MVFAKQNDIHTILDLGDNRSAGNTETTKQTTGGIRCIGDHTVKIWASAKSIIALCTGKAELYASFAIKRFANATKFKSIAT